MDALSTNSEIDFWQSSRAAAVLVKEDYTIGLHRVMSFDIASSPSSSYLDSSVYPDTHTILVGLGCWCMCMCRLYDSLANSFSLHIHPKT